jgi:FkbM family methyltransferase
MIPHYNEDYFFINTNVLEVEEQNDAMEYIRKDDIVLELGGRYGTVSTIINNLLKNKENHVVIEPDLNVIDALRMNRENHGCKFEIFTGIITNKTKLKINHDGYGTYISDGSDGIDEIETITYKNLCKKYNLSFNTLVVDCEGCFCDVLDSIGEDIVSFDKILLELDQPNICNYQIVEDKLSPNFYKLKSGFHSVYINKNFLSRKKNENDSVNYKILFGLFILLIALFFIRMSLMPVPV